MKKIEVLREIAAALGVKGSIEVRGDLWGYGKVRYDEECCIGCGKCEEVCSEGAIKYERIFDLPKLFEKEIEEDGTKKRRVLNLIKSLSLKKPQTPIEIPEFVTGYGKVLLEDEKCDGCGRCERHCSGGALKVEKVVRI